MEMIRVADVPMWIDRNLNFQFKSQSTFHYDGHTLSANIAVPNAVHNVFGHSKGEIIPITGYQPFPSHEGFVHVNEIIRNTFILIGTFVMHEFCELFTEARSENVIFDPHVNSKSHFEFATVLERATDSLPRREAPPRWMGSFEVVELFPSNLKGLIPEEK